MPYLNTAIKHIKIRQCIYKEYFIKDDILYEIKISSDAIFVWRFKGQVDLPVPLSFIF